MLAPDERPMPGHACPSAPLAASPFASPCDLGGWPAPPWAPDAIPNPAELRQAVALDMSGAPASPEAHALADAALALAVAWEAAQGGRRRRGESERAKLRGAVAAVLHGLLRAWRSHAAPAYRATVKQAFSGGPVGFRQFVAAADAMEGAGLIGRAEGIRWLGKNPFGGPAPAEGMAARYWPTAALLVLATQHGVTRDAFKGAFACTPSDKAPQVDDPVRLYALPANPRETRKQLPIDPADETAAKLRAEVEGQNALAASVAVTGCTPPRWRRHFHGDWSGHGRWYAAGEGNYQAMPEAERLAITIGGEPVAELDLRAAHLTLMHGLLGLPAPEGDPYALPDAPGVPRDLVKRWVTETLGKGSPAERWAKKATETAPKVPAREVGAAVKVRYPFMAEPWSALPNAKNRQEARRTLGHRLCCIEARIIAAVMAHLRAQGILSLPMHDGLIVPRSAEGMAAADLATAGRVIGRVVPQVTVATLPGT